MQRLVRMNSGGEARVVFPNDSYLVSKHVKRLFLTSL
jgi:hypothetical protein